MKKFGIVMVGIIEDESGCKIEDLFANLRDIIQQKTPLLLRLYDLVVAPAASDGVVNKVLVTSLALIQFVSTKYTKLLNI